MEKKGIWWGIEKEMELSNKRNKNGRRKERESERVGVGWESRAAAE